MILAYYNIEKILKYNKSRHRAFYYHYYTSDIAKYTAAVERWKGKSKELKEMAKEIMEDNESWYKKDITNHEKNLSGLEFRGLELTKRIKVLEHTNLEYCTFECCQFKIKDFEIENEEIFFESKLNHSIFRNCEFENLSFGAGEYQNVVFYCCKFKNVVFNKNKDGKYRNIFFQNCEFENVDFKKVNASSFCFWGECFFENVIYSDETFPSDKIIGQEILNFCRKADEETYHTRKELGYIGGPYNKIEIMYFNEEDVENSEAQGKVYKYSSLINCYIGLAKLYKYLYQSEESDGVHSLYLKYSYFNSWLDDQINFYTVGYLNNIKGLISRHILGYGVKAERTLLTLLVLALIFSFCFMLSGVNTPHGLIKRPLSFNFDYLGSTIEDLYQCMYYVITTLTSTGYGEYTPATDLSRFLANLVQIFGLLLFTMFTVIVGRRFIK